VIKLGYKFKLIRGYEFSKYDLFNSGLICKLLYSGIMKKKYATGPQRFIAKMHLNQFYGYFGRTLELIETLNVYTKDLKTYITARVIKTIININEKVSTILTKVNININIITELNSELDIKLNTGFKPVKSNVAIAAAVTSYARIHMNPYKLLPGTAYTDTDSILTLAERCFTRKFSG
jgi:hypothetical protein